MRKISGNKLMILAGLLCIGITVMYARSMTVLYGATELLMAGFCYLLILTKWRKMDSILLLIVVVLTGLSLFNGFLRFDLRSVVLLSISLVLPLGISVLPMDFTMDKRTFRSAFLIALILCAVQQYTGFFGYINSNTLGFMIYMCVSLGFVWILCGKNKLVPFLCVLFGAITSLYTGSRNVAIVMAIAGILMLFPRAWYNKKAFFRAIYLLVLLYTVFASAIMEWGFNNEFISNLLYDYTEQYSEKMWEMAGRIGFLQNVKSIIDGLPLFHKLFGEGIFMRHGHNMFYQSIFIYGYLGTAALYIFYIRIFEMARKLVHFHGDKIALGCTVALLGCFMLNGADVFLIGIETCAVIPQVLMGIIIFRYRAMMHPQTQLTEGEMTRGPAETNQNLG